MQVAITGGTGFIGRCLVKQHLLRGDSVCVLSREKRPAKQGIEYNIGDLLDKNFHAAKFVEGVDVLYHCAGQLHDESVMGELHIDGMLRLLKFAKGHVKRWVQLSSVGVYKKQKQGTVDEDTAIDPEGVYEKTKALADSKLIKYATENGMDYTILRPSNVFGDNMTNQSLASLVALIRKKLFFYIGKNAPLTNYVSVDDVVKALMACATDPRAQGEVFNLSQSVGVKEMIHALARGVGVSEPKKHLPEMPIRLLTRLLERLPGFPLSTDRINALTNHVLFSSDKIQKQLGFSYGQELVQSLNRYSASLSR